MVKKLICLMILLGTVLSVSCSGGYLPPNTTVSVPDFEIPDPLETPPAPITAPVDTSYYAVPDGTYVIDGNKESVLDELYVLLEKKAEYVCVKNYIPIGLSDICAMPYSVFWLDDYGCKTTVGHLMGETVDSPIQLYRFRYFDDSYDDIEKMKEEIDLKAAEIASLVPEDADIFEKALIVHDELIRRVTFDDSVSLPHIYDTYGALVNGDAVCSGYACAFSHIMDMLGEKCPIVLSDSHAWNSIQARTSEEFIATWDDPDMKDKKGKDYIEHAYFGLTREEVEKTDFHAIEGGADSYTDYVADPIVMNYYRHEGYMAEEYDTKFLISVFKKQLKSGSNVLTVRFENEEDFLKAKALFDGDGSSMNRILKKAGYKKMYYYSFDDVLHVVCININPDL